MKVKVAAVQSKTFLDADDLPVFDTPFGKAGSLRTADALEHQTRHAPGLASPRGVPEKLSGLVEAQRDKTGGDVHAALRMGGTTVAVTCQTRIASVGSGKK